MAKYNNYFPHDANLRNTSPILMLRMRLGLEGYGAYCMILERLRSENDYTGVRDYDMMAFDLRCDRELVRAVVEDFGLFDLGEDGESVTSNSLTEWMKPLDSAQDAKKAAAEKRWGGKKKGSGADAEHMQSGCGAYAEDDAAHMQSENENDAVQCYKRKEKKINKRKINKEKEEEEEETARGAEPPAASSSGEKKIFSLADAVEGLKLDTDWLESVAEVTDVDVALLPGMLDIFAAYTKGRGKRHTDMGDAMSNFMSWAQTKHGQQAMAKARRRLREGGSGEQRDFEAKAASQSADADEAKAASQRVAKPDDVIRGWGFDPAKVSMAEAMRLRREQQAAEQAPRPPEGGGADAAKLTTEN